MPWYQNRGALNPGNPGAGTPPPSTPQPGYYPPPQAPPGWGGGGSPPNGLGDPYDAYRGMPGGPQTGAMMAQLFPTPGGGPGGVGAGGTGFGPGKMGGANMLQQRGGAPPPWVTGSGYGGYGGYGAGGYEGYQRSSTPTPPPPVPPPPVPPPTGGTPPGGSGFGLSGNQNPTGQTPPPPPAPTGGTPAPTGGFGLSGNQNPDPRAMGNSYRSPTGDPATWTWAQRYEYSRWYDNWVKGRPGFPSGAAAHPWYVAADATEPPKTPPGGPPKDNANPRDEDPAPTNPPPTTPAPYGHKAPPPPKKPTAGSMGTNWRGNDKALLQYQKDYKQWQKHVQSMGPNRPFKIS